MIFKPSTLLFFTALASNASNSFAATTERRSLLRSSSSKEEVAPYDNNHNASLSLMRRKLDESMPPEGYSIRCLQEPDKVYRWTEGELRYYPTGQVASSWNTAWREELVQMDCVNIPKGAPMSMNFDFLTLSRAVKGFSEAEVYSVRCLQEPSKVYRWHEGELHHYPTSAIASSWDEDWREALVETDCFNIPKGEPMSDKNTVDDSRAMAPLAPFKTNSELKTAAGEYCNDPDEWENNPMFTTHGPIEDWNVSEIVDMSNVFYYKSLCNPNLAKWDVSNVQTFDGMFFGANSFNGDISGWDTSSATSIGIMFYAAEAFNGDISKWDTSSVTNIKAMFAHARSFNGDISGWDTSSANDFSWMFYDATSFNQNLCSWKVNSSNANFSDNFCTGASCGDCTF